MIVCHRAPGSELWNGDGVCKPRHTECRVDVLSLLRRRVSAWGGTHETIDPVEAVQSVCCSEYNAAYIRRGNAHRARKLTERVTPRSDIRAIPRAHHGSEGAGQ